jgi:hypothetical protein
MFTGFHDLSRFKDGSQTIPAAALNGVLRAKRRAVGPIAKTFQNERGRKLRGRLT